MSGPKPGFLQAVYIALLLLNELPRDLTRLQVVAIIPRPVELASSSGSSEISGLEPTRSEILPATHSVDTLDKLDEPRDHERRTDANFAKLDNILPAHGHPNIPERAPATSSSRADTDNRDVGHDGKPRPIRDTQANPVAVEKGPGYTGSNINAHPYNPHGGQPISNNLGEADQGYRGGYYYNPPISHFQMVGYYLDYSKPVVVPSQGYVYAPVMQSDIRYLPDQSHLQAASFAPSHSNVQPTRAPTVPGHSSQHKNVSNLPPRFGRLFQGHSQNDQAPSQSRTSDQVGSANHVLAEKKELKTSDLKSSAAESSSRTKYQVSSKNHLKTSPAESSSKAINDKFSQGPEIPDGSNNLAQGSSGRPKHQSKKTEANGKSSAYETLEKTVKASEARPFTPEVLHQTTNSLEEASEAKHFIPEVLHRATDSLNQPSGMPGQVSQSASSELKKPNLEDLKNSQGVPNALGPAADLDNFKRKELAPGKTMPVPSVSATAVSSHDRVTFGSSAAEAPKRVNALESVERVNQVPSEKKRPPYRNPTIAGSIRSSRRKNPDLVAAVTKLEVVSSPRAAPLPRVAIDRMLDSAQPPQENRFAALEKFSSATPDSNFDDQAGAAERLVENNNSERDSAIHESDSHDHPGAAEQLDESENHTPEVSVTPDSATSLKRTYNPRVILDSTMPYLESGANLALNAWYKVPSLRALVPSFLFQTFTMTDHFSKKSLCNFLANSRSKFGNTVSRGIGYNSHPVPIGFEEESSPASSSKSLISKSGEFPIRDVGEGSPQGSGILNGRPGFNSVQTAKEEPNPSSRRRKNVQLMPKELLPDYIIEYTRKNPAANKKEIDLVRVLGKFLKADLVERNTPINFHKGVISLDKEQDAADLKAIEDFISQSEGRFVQKQLKWLVEKTGDIEARRRWTALVRQCKQPIIVRQWEQLLKATPHPEVVRIGGLIKMGEYWPTFYHAKTSGFAWPRNEMRPILDILGKGELAFRVKSIFMMSRRVYPRNWLDPEGLKAAYQQGLDTNRIILVGDFLQFGRDYHSLDGGPGLASFQGVYKYLRAMWDSDTQWGASAEKMWFLSDPDREKIYTERYQRLRKAWKHSSINPMELIDVDIDDLRGKLKSLKVWEVWWNLSDSMDWREYCMAPSIMVKLGLDLKIPQDRNQDVNLEKLDEILGTSTTIPNKMKKIIKDWFQNNGKSPYDYPNNVRTLRSSEPGFSLSRELSKLRDWSVASWRQGTFRPSSDLDLLIGSKILVVASDDSGNKLGVTDDELISSLIKGVKQHRVRSD